MYLSISNLTPMMDIYEIIFFICFGLVLAYIILRSMEQNRHEIDDYILNYYQGKKLKVSKILELNLREKIRYGLPIINYRNLLFPGNFSVSNSTTYHARKVELFDDNNEEYTKYLGLDIVSGNVINCNEIDSYNI